MAATMPDIDIEARVRALWHAYERGGVEAMRGLAGPDVEWVPWSAGGAVLHGEREFEDWYSSQIEHPLTASVHGFETHGSCVLAHGSLRVHRDGGFLDVQPSWVCSFRAGRLLRVVAYVSRSEALEAIREFNSEE